MGTLRKNVHLRVKRSRLKYTSHVIERGAQISRAAEFTKNAKFWAPDLAQMLAKQFFDNYVAIFAVSHGLTYIEFSVKFYKSVDRTLKIGPGELL